MMVMITSKGKLGQIDCEKRIVKDDNNYYDVQVRFLPLEPWESNDGWMTDYTTAIYERALAIFEGR